MKLSDIQKDIEKLIEQYGDCEVAVPSYDILPSWRRYSKPNCHMIRSADIMDVVDGDYGDYVPVDVINSKRGYIASYTEELKKRPNKRVLYIQL